MLADALDEIARRLAAEGHAGGRAEPNRVVVGLDADNLAQAWVTALDRQRLSVQVRSRRRVPRALWPAALRRVNEWNGRPGITTAWLAVDDWESSDDGAIVVEACLAASDDHSVDQIAAFADLAVSEGRSFWS